MLKLSDAFDTDTEPDIEVRVTMININYGHNRELLEDCEPLGDYAYFVYDVRAKQKILGSLEAAIDAAIEELADDSLIKPFLIANRAKVKNMFITEYDQERHDADLKAEGREEGEVIGTVKTLISLVKKGFLPISQAADEANMSVAEFKLQMEQV